MGRGEERLKGRVESCADGTPGASRGRGEVGRVESVASGRWQVKVCEKLEPRVSDCMY